MSEETMIEPEVGQPKEYKYTIIEGNNTVVYEGFLRIDCTPPDGKLPGVIAWVKFDGDDDLYQIDPERISLGVSEIKRMYYNDYAREPSFVRVYTNLAY
jgi:hypothetical protein